MVEDPIRFLGLELVPGRSAGHRLRGSGLTCYLRHRTRDVDVFKEVFGSAGATKSYEPPQAVAAMLDAKDSPRFLDIGGNIGLFGLYVLGRWPSSKITSYEPDPDNLPIIRRVIADNRLENRWTLIPAAAAASDDELLFVSGLLAESKVAGLATASSRDVGAASVEDGTTVSVPAVDVFARNHEADLLKLDIEGGEWALLRDPRLATLKAQAVVLEWHETGSPEGDSRTNAIELLDAAGYSERHETEDFGYRGVLWAWR